jgi:hypothetical protein
MRFFFDGAGSLVAGVAVLNGGRPHASPVLEAPHSVSLAKLQHPSRLGEQCISQLG